MTGKKDQRQALKREIQRLIRVRDRSARVLVVDDTQTMRLLLAQALKGAGFQEVLRAADGEAGLKLLLEPGCDLALVDWSMPRMSGLELLEAVRSRPELQDIIFIMVTAETLDRKVIQAAEEKQDAYLTKPLSPEKLTRRLELVLEKRLTTAQARLAELRGEIDKAVEVYLNAAHNRPRANWPLFGLGALLTRQGRYQDAERCYRRLLELDPQALAAMVELGRLRMRQGKEKQGRDLFMRALKLNPQFFKAYDALAESLLEEGQHHKALKVLEGAVKVHGSQNAERQELFGRLHYQMGNYAEAEAAFEKTLELKPHRKPLDNSLALARSRLAQGRLEDALPVLDQLARADSPPDQEQLEAQLDAMLLLGATYVHAGQVEEAEQVFQTMKDPATWGGELPFKENHLHRELGGIYLRAEQTDQARRHFATSVELDPDDQENLKAMRELGSELGHEDLVEEEAAQSRQRREQAVLLHTRRGLELVAQGRYQEALQEYRQGLSMDPASGRLHFNLSKLRYRLKQTDHAFTGMTVAARLGVMRRDWQLVAEVGRFFARVGKPQQAREILEAALEQEPKQRLIAEVLAELEGEQNALQEREASA